MSDPEGDRPAHRQVADQLRAMIETGTWPAGHKLPSESELMTEFGVSRVVVRLAVGVLRDDGLIVTRQRRGSYVANPEANRRIPSSRYQQDTRVAAGWQAEPTTLGISDGEDHSRYRLERGFSEERATRQVADLLGRSEGEAVLKRRYIYYLDERPDQITTSYLPLRLVRGTPVANPANEPWPGGTIAQLASLGQHVTRVEESVRSRMPTPDESTALRIAVGTPVLVVTRRMFTGVERDQPVEAAVIVLVSNSVTLDYVLDFATEPDTIWRSSASAARGETRPAAEGSERQEVVDWPVSIYLKDGSVSEGERVRHAVVRALDDIEFDLAAEDGPILGSFWQRARAVSRRPETKQALGERLTKLERAAEVHLLAVPESQANMQNAQGVAAIIEALKGESIAAVQLGPLLIVKAPGPNGNSTILCKTLTASELKKLERSPDLLSDPISLISQLPSISEPPAIE